MKVGVHAQVLMEEKLTGIGYYTYHLLGALAKQEQKNDYLLFSNGALKNEVSGRDIQHHITESNGFFSYMAFPKALKAHNCDVAFLPKEVVPFGLSQPTVTSVFDLYYLKCPRKIRKKIPYKAWLHYFIAAHVHLPRAKKILAISEDTKKDLIEIVKIPEERIIVTPLGYDPDVFSCKDPKQVEEILSLYQINTPYFINTSSVWWERKNLLRLLQAYSKLKKTFRSDHKLVITGKKGSSYPAMIQLIQEHHLENDVFLLEYVPREHLPFLLQGASALVFPSLHEGFGLPILEAMAVGCPVITSSVSATLEVGKDAALLVDPLNEDEIRDAMERIIKDPSLYWQLREKGFMRAREFSWDRTASLTMRAFAESLC